jgi:hypothetical protein
MFVILLIGLIILDKLPFDSNNNFPFKEIRGEFIPFLLIAFLVFLGGYLAWFIWNYLNYWKIDSKGILIRRFILRTKLFEWKIVEAISGDSDSVSILSDNWKIRARIHFIDFDSYKVLSNYLGYYKYSTLDPERRTSGSDWAPIG